MYHHILIPTDGSELSKKAIQEGVALAKAVGAHVTGLTVSAPWHVFAVEPAAITDIADTYAKRMAKTSAERLDVIKTTAAASGVKCDTVGVEDEHPYHAIIDTAEKQGCDAIVMASHGRRGVSAVVLGSETVKVLTHSKIPVVVCR
jgi:nucleotide-binding universal stress UspA family protein